jgi:hypothetical protein
MYLKEHHHNSAAWYSVDISPVRIFQICHLNTKLHCDFTVPRLGLQHTQVLKCKGDRWKS